MTGKFQQNACIMKTWASFHSLLGRGNAHWILPLNREQCLANCLCRGKMINALCQVLIKWCGTCTVSFLFLGRMLVTASKQSRAFPELRFCSPAPNELSCQPASCYVHAIKYVPCFHCLLFLFYFYCFCGFFSSSFIFLFLLLDQLREIVCWLLLKSSFIWLL